LLAASATRDGNRIITVVFDSPDYVAESVQLMELGFAQVGPEPRNGSGQQHATSPGGLLAEFIRSVAPLERVSAQERARLRGLLRSELIGFQSDPALRAPADSVFDRLKAARSIPPTRR
jgi:D-alanyl-D-alanine carboxypeptidase